MSDIRTFTEALERHDWFHEWSDDGRVYREGRADRAKLFSIAKEKGIDYQAAVNTVFAQHFPKSVLPFPNATNGMPENTKPTNKTSENTTMEPWKNITLGQIVTAVTALVLGNPSPAPTIETTVETPKKPGRPKKTDTPADDGLGDGEGAPGVTMDDIRAAAAAKIKSGGDANKAKIKGFIKKLGHEELVQVKPDQFERLLKAINNLPDKAEDTDDL